MVHHAIAMKQTDPQFKLRISPYLKKLLEESAALNNRSVTAEITHRLLGTFFGTAEEHDATNEQAMEERARLMPTRWSSDSEPEEDAGVAASERAIADRIAKEVSDRLSMDIDARMSKLYDDMMRHLIHGTPILEEPHFPKPGRPDIPHAKAHKTPKK